MANEDRATRYHRLQRRASVLAAVAGAVLLVILLLTGASAGIRDLATAVTGGWFVGTVVVYVVLLALVYAVVQLPTAYYQGMTLERRYGLSVETTGKWWADQLKAFALAIVLGSVGALLVLAWIGWSPERWWIGAAVSCSILLIVLAHLAPVLLLPIFYEIRPLNRPALVSRLVALAERTGTRVVGVFEWRLGDRTRKANAALTGIGATRRILLSDTLLAEHSDDEIEVILAHELAHAVHRDLWSSIAFESALLLTGFYVANVMLSAGAGWLGLTSKADPAALPLLLLAAGAVSLALMPVANAFSRSHERRADRYALEATRNARAFTTAMRRLAAQNLAEERPSRMVEIFFYSHPPVAARIEAARVWASGNGPVRENL